MSIVLVGPPAAGKSTVGALLATALHRDFVDADAVTDHPHAVLALGAGHTHVTRPDLRARVGAALASAERVVLLRPAADVERSVRVLRERSVVTKGHDWVRDGVDWLERWCSDGLDDEVATTTVLTAGQTPEQTVAQVLVG